MCLLSRTIWQKRCALRCSSILHQANLRCCDVMNVASLTFSNAIPCQRLRVRHELVLWRYFTSCYIQIIMCNVEGRSTTISKTFAPSSSVPDNLNNNTLVRHIYAFHHNTTRSQNKNKMCNDKIAVMFIYCMHFVGPSMWWVSSSSAIFCSCTNQLHMKCAESLASSQWSKCCDHRSLVRYGAQPSFSSF